MSQQTYQGVVDRFEEKFAVVKLNGGGEVLWPIKDLARDIAVGASLNIVMATGQAEQANQEALAKAMLNEILNVRKE